jgi:type II pantothenate kinase
LNEKGYHASGRAAVGPAAVGVDVGATLAKIASRRGDDPPRFELVPAADLAGVADAVRALAPSSVGATGGGAAELSRLLDSDTARVNEFAAWGTGAGALLCAHEGRADERYLLVSLGTGTSIMLVDGMSVTRVGGTALGGGTVLGLGALLTGELEFAAIAGLAARGVRREIDLLVSDIYRAGEIPLAADLTASSFGRVARAAGSGRRPQPADLAHALMGLVGENVALLCGGLAAATQVRRVVFAGSTLRGNTALEDVLRQITSALGREPRFLRDGEFAGALGALLLASARS